MLKYGDKTLKTLTFKNESYDNYPDLKEITLKLGDLTDNEREIILKGCLINYYKG